MLKKKLTAALATVMLLASANAAYAQGGIQVNVNGRTSSNAAIVQQNRTLIPLRFVSEELNYRVDWNQARKEANVTNGYKKLTFTVNSPMVKVQEGRTYATRRMDTVPVIKNNRTYIPLRFLGENLDCHVRYDYQKRIAKIFKSPAIRLNRKYIRTNNQAYIENGTTYVGLRVISQNLGYKIDYNRDANGRSHIAIKNNGKTINFIIGENIAYINGRPVQMQKAVIHEGTTYVPVRFIAEAFGMDVQWNQAQYEINIDKKSDTPIPDPQPQPKPEPKPQPKPEPEPNVVPQPWLNPINPDPRPEPKPQPKPEPQPQPRPEPKPEPKTEPEVDPKELLPVRNKEDAANYLADSVLDGKTYIEVVYDTNKTNFGEILNHENKTRKTLQSYANQRYFEPPITLSNGKEYRAIRITYDTTELEAKNFMKNWVQAKTNNSMTDFEKAQKIVDYIRRNYCYQADRYHARTYDFARMYQTKHGICHEFTIFTNAMLHYAGIETRYVANLAHDHAWSMMKLNGQWYHTDVTWMKPIGLERNEPSTQEYIYKSNAQEYFLMSANDIKKDKDHQFDESLYPNAPSTYPRDQIGL